MYPALVANADVLGFDLYPLQNWCRYDDFGHVFDAQRELVALASGKPTFQWIKARTMDCHDPTLDPSADTVHAETWLAIAGGATGIGYFPDAGAARAVARGAGQRLGSRRRTRTRWRDLRDRGQREPQAGLRDDHSSAAR